MELNRFEKEKGEEFVEGSGWDDPIVRMLEELLLENLRLVFQSAIEEIVERGYDEAVVEKAISSRGLYAGSKDSVTSIVNVTLNLLWMGEKFDTSMDYEFGSIQHLTECTLLEMVGLLREVRPFLSVGEAMWWLLICDLNAMQACRLEEESSSSLRCGGSSEKNSSDSMLSQLRSESQNQLTQTLSYRDFLKRLTLEKSHSPDWTTKDEEKLAFLFGKLEDFWDCYGKNGRAKCQSFALRESLGGGGGRRGHLKREMTRLMPKPGYSERYCQVHGSKGLLGSRKLASDGGILTDSKLKCSCGSGMSLEIEPSKKTTGSGGKAPLANEKHKSSANTPSSSLVTCNSSKSREKATVTSLPTNEKKLVETRPSGPKPDLKSFVDSTGSHELADYCGNIPYDKSSGKYLPQHKKDEHILKLVHRLQGLQDELQGWTEWANQKIMQAARKLGKVQPELQTLRQLTEAAKKFIQENNATRLAIVENGVNGINSLVDKGNSVICKLEQENARMKKELEAAKSNASRSFRDYREALEREQKAKHEIHSWDREIGILQKELETEKKKLAALQEDFVKAKNTHNKMEARLERERSETEKLLAKAASIKNEREQLEAVVKAEVDNIKHEAKTMTRKCMEDIGKLRSRFPEAVSKCNAARIAALKRGAKEGFEKPQMEASGLITKTGDQNCLSHYSSKDLRQERECVMCLSEEMSVVFIPCSHQVLCKKCNELHEKRGMKDCPSCRTPIQRRIKVRFANS